jgi:hypothetical protein
MDEARVRAMLGQHFASSDSERSHEMYHDDAVLEFPQSGERFVGDEISDMEKQLSRDTTVEFRDIRAETISGSGRSRSATTKDLGASGSASSSFGATRSRVSRSTSPRAGTHQSGGLLEGRAIGRYGASVDPHTPAKDRRARSPRQPELACANRAKRHSRIV